ncbi:MAG: methyltransferase domain-containing protein [Alphaproteobacteria bacterium]|nr:methyltransferase domain-containing protein [Alphaproteobacteria bacterium]
MRVFDRRIVAQHRARAAADLAAHDFLFREVADRLADRLDDVVRRFPVALDLGCHGGHMAQALGRRGGVEHLVQADLASAMARRARDAAAASGRPVSTLAADEEALPFAPGSFDLILSCLGLHWVNDLPGALLQMRMALKPDGMVLAAMLGGDTLIELREALADAEIATAGGLSPHVSPFADTRDAGALMQRAGFALPVVDSDRIVVSYPDALALMRDLRGMGETNAVIERRRAGLRRATLFAAVERYRERHAADDGRITATFQVIYLTAWAPHPAQQKPLAPGSARSRLADALNTEERPAGEKTPPVGPPPKRPGAIS